MTERSAAAIARSAPVRVVALIVTWNRREHVHTALAALSLQSALANADDRSPAVELHVVVIDNAGTDGTASAIARDWRPDAIVENQTDRAHHPNFVAGDSSLRSNTTSITKDNERQLGGSPPPARSAFASLTLVRNSHNLGGCGGFNTGFAYTAHAFTAHASATHPSTAQPSTGDRSPHFVWLVDDDVDLPTDALHHLLLAMQSDDSIGLVGSRTVDIRDRLTTIETTIYFDRALGRMCPEPPAHHPRYTSHRAWLAGPSGGGGVRVGRGHYSGIIDVDVVSACSMLARWSDVIGTPPSPPQPPGIGFWDKRYFIYCDDADWSLRFGRAGRRVVLNLDAVVYHTPWLLKLTPQKLYYAQRNAAWMTRKLYNQTELPRITRLWMRSLLRDALGAITHRRLTHGQIILQTINDVIDQRWGIDGKTAPTPPAPASPSQLNALVQRASGRSRPIAFVVHHESVLSLVRAFLDRACIESKSGESPQRALHRKLPRVLLIVSNTVHGFEHAAPSQKSIDALGFANGAAVVFGQHSSSKLKKQWAVWRLRPAAVVVFDNTCPIPILTACPTIHLDSRTPYPHASFIEHESWPRRLILAIRTLLTAIKAARYALTVRPDSGQQSG